MALNKIGVSFLDLITHETMLHYPFTEVISTRKVQTDDGTLYLDMKCGKFGFVRAGCPRMKAPLYFYAYLASFLKRFRFFYGEFKVSRLDQLPFNLLKFSKIEPIQYLDLRPLPRSTF